MTEKQKKAIRALYSEGRNLNSIAAMYMISVNEIHEILAEHEVEAKPAKTKKVTKDETLFPDEPGV